jgi:uncharacterized Zn finger protein
MSYGYGGWEPYITVAERRRNVQREIEKLRKKGKPVAPVIIEGRTIAASFWGKAWCRNLESYHDFESRLPRGRSYVRNGAVLDLQIAPLSINALVSGSSIYKVKVTIAAAPEAHWHSLCRDCAGSIDSLVELLRGRFSKGIMERICRQDQGLFPRPSEIKFTCSCPDFASMCKHVAAVLYGVGARLDEKPELLFRLRSVDENDLLAHLDASGPLSMTGPATGKMLVTDDISALFGIEMAADEASSVSKAPPQKQIRGRPKPVEPQSSELKPAQWKKAKASQPATKQVGQRKSAQPKTKQVEVAKKPSVTQKATPAKRVRKSGEDNSPAQISQPLPPPAKSRSKSLDRKKLPSKNPKKESRAG